MTKLQKIGAFLFCFVMCAITLVWFVVPSGRPPYDEENEAPPIVLKGEAPEDFDWPAYFEKDFPSNSGERLRYLAAADLLQQRVEGLSSQYRALLIKRAPPEAVALFDEMQEQWTKSAIAQIQMAGDSYKGGSLARVVFPMERFRVNLDRARALKELKAYCLYLND